MAADVSNHYNRENENITFIEMINSSNLIFCHHIIGCFFNLFSVTSFYFSIFQLHSQSQHVCNPFIPYIPIL